MPKSSNLSQRPFFAPSQYPELAPVQREWRALCDEGRRLRPHMMWVEDARTRGPVWAFAPLQPEEEDRGECPEELIASLRAMAPRTVGLVGSIPGILGYGFSLLLSGGLIALHAHENPYVTALLGLSHADPCVIRVGPAARRILPGRLLIFDYTLPHEVANESGEDRLALLILLRNKQWLQRDQV